jgi:hypothetical protein
MATSRGTSVGGMPGLGSLLYNLDILSSTVPDVYNITGLAATGIYSPVNNAISSTVPGNYVVFGFDTKTHILATAWPSDVTITGFDTAAFNSSGTPVSSTTPGAYSITGFATSSYNEYVGFTNPASYVITGFATDYTHVHNGITVPAAYTINGVDATAIREVPAQTGAGSIVITGFATDTVRSYVSPALLGTLVITGYPTTVPLQVSLGVSKSSLRYGGRQKYSRSYR